MVLSAALTGYALGRIGPIIRLVLTVGAIATITAEPVSDVIGIALICGAIALAQLWRADSASEQ